MNTQTGAVEDMNQANHETVCQEERCVACRNIDNCNDAIRHILDGYKKRAMGETTHDEFLATNRNRFGGYTSRPRGVYTVRRHWREILAGNTVWFKAVVKDITGSIPEKRPAERAKVLKSDRGEEYASLLEELAKNHWYSPHIADDGKLTFRTDTPFAYARQGKEAKPVESDPDFIHEADEPEMEELTQEELIFG